MWLTENQKKIEIYEIGSSSFDINTAEPAATLSYEDIKDSSITREINGDFRFSFKTPLADEGILDYLKTNNAAALFLPESDGKEIFRISSVSITNDGTKYAEIEATQIFLETRKAMVVSVDEMIGASVDYVVSTLWEAASANSNAINQFGLTLTVDDDIADFQIDYPLQEKTSLYDCLKTVIELLGFGEIEINGTYAAIVRTIDGGSYSAIKLGTNAQSIKTTSDMSSIITRVYPFGSDSLDISSIYLSGYIDSENIALYGVRESTVEYSEITDASTLLSRAEWLFDEQNPERIDIPSVTVDVSAVNLAYTDEEIEPYRIGGEVSVTDNTLINNPLRIIKLTYSPYEPQQYSLTLGRIKTDLWQYLKTVDNTSRKLKTTIKTEVNNNVYTEIVEVTKESVIAADVIEATAAFSENLYVEKLFTNVKEFKCIPNLTLDGSTPQWADEEKHTYTCSNTESMRGCVEIENISLKFKEYQLQTADDYTALTADDIEAFTIDGKQIYYTSILGAENPYEYFTFVSPTEKYSDISSENAEMFKVYIRKSTAEFTKAEFEFTKVASESYGQTYNIRLILGTGDDNGYGQALMRKETDGFYFTYTSRTDFEDKGIKITDEGAFLMQDGETTALIPMHIVDTLPDEPVTGHLYFIG